MHKSFYKIALRFKTPSEKGKNLEFRELKEDIIEAIKEFNEKFRNWSKRLILCKFSNHLNMILVIEKEKEKVTAREIRSFTAYLYHEKDWSIYSRETSKLFEGVQFSMLSLKEAKDELISIKTKEFGNIQKEDIEEIELYINKHMNEKNNNTIKPIIHDEMYIDELSDKQSFAIFKYLLETKDLGNNHLDKKETISKIKNILLQWI